MRSWFSLCYDDPFIKYIFLRAKNVKTWNIITGGYNGTEGCHLNAYLIRSPTKIFPKAIILQYLPHICRSIIIVQFNIFEIWCFHWFVWENCRTFSYSENEMKFRKEKKFQMKQNQSSILFGDSTLSSTIQIEYDTKKNKNKKH